MKRGKGSERCSQRNRPDAAMGNDVSIVFQNMTAAPFCIRMYVPVFPFLKTCADGSRIVGKVQSLLEKACEWFAVWERRCTCGEHQLRITIETKILRENPRRNTFVKNRIDSQYTDWKETCPL